MVPIQTVEIEEYQDIMFNHDYLDRAWNLLWEKYQKEVEVDFPSPKTKNKWKIKSKGWVGYIPLTPEIILYLKPKVEVGNIFRMLEYAYKFDDLEFGKGYINCDKIEDIYSHIANLLAKRIIDRESQGLYRAYVPKTDYLTFVRGRIDIQNAIKKPWNIKLKCHYDEQTVDIEDNQILAWTLDIIINSSLWTEQVPVPPSVRQAYHALQGLVTLKEFQPEDCIGRIYNYLNQDYQLLHSLCRFFVESAGPSHQIGDRTMLPFLIDMAKLYELFVAKWLEKKLPSHLFFKRQEPINISSNITFIPDIILYEALTEKARYILDTKYKTPDSPAAKDVAQVIAYAVSKECQEVILVYPTSLKYPLDTLIGNIRVRSLTFSLDGNLEDAGKSFLKELFF
ncbi:restriction endonuclease [Phormidium sp. LEGE 05292]|uniref:McrC family protein n=1 Tax=[Phormidium] sp. LEGE 05292 TaxID=767427 RepID=UPI0018807E16|nr:restriction endonuclease [Phormidium sp. LEGE 05292]MBE9226239.1 restriction endonuclease [Phormidium sp. LEGE 05292]